MVASKPAFALARTVCTYGRSANPIAITTVSAATAFGSHVPRSLGTPLSHRTATTISVATTTTAVTASSGINAALMLAR